MRLLRVSFTGADGPVAECDVPLGNLTAVLGLNDAGKSRFVEAIIDAVDGTLAARANVRIVAELGDEDLADLFGIDTLLETDMDDDYWSARARGFVAHGSQPVGDAIDRMAATFVHELEDVPERLCARIREMLGASRFFEFERDPEYHHWQVMWCAPPAVVLPDDVASLLSEVIDDRKLDRRPVSEPQPIVSARPDGITPKFMPRAFAVPIGPDALAREATVVVAGLARFVAAWDMHRGVFDRILECFEHGTGDEFAQIEDSLDEGMFGTFMLAPEPPVRELFEDADDDSAAARPDVLHICDLVATLASELAPEFIKQRYDFTVSVPRTVEADSDAGVEIRLVPSDVLSDGPGSSAAPDRSEVDGLLPSALGDGYYVWLELAVLQALERVARLTRELQWTITRVHEESADWLEYWPGFEAAKALDDTGKLATGPNRWQLAAGRLSLRGRSTGTDGFEGLRQVVSSESTDWNLCALHDHEYTAALSGVAYIRRVLTTVAELRSGTGADVVGRRDVVGPRHIFVLDEPERHLHPRAARQLASWLRDFVGDGTQTIITTHSPAFITAADTLLYVERAALGDATVHASDPAALTALSEIAADLGLNRGELFAGRSLFLFVEDLSDLYVLEGLFGNRLRRTGVEIIPLGGATQSAQIVDSQLLIRYSTAPLALLVDDLSREFVVKVQNDPDFREKQKHSRKLEKKAVAELFVAAAARQRTVKIVALPKKDIFFALDPEAIRQTFGERRDEIPEYPGHDEFWSAFEREQKKDEQYKFFRERRYGIPAMEVTWYARAADWMRVNNIRSPVLEDVIAELLERLEPDW